MKQDIIMIRHAQSTWNAEFRFTGWANPPLTENGQIEAERAAVTLAKDGYEFDKAYTSVLQRAQQTARIILNNLGQSDLEIEADWRLNERHYGSLQGLNKKEMTADVGEDQVWRWRRAYLEKPPALDMSDERHPRNDPIYSGIDPDLLPGSENLEMTQKRVMAFWQERVLNDMKEGKRLFISAHGNTLRALIMGLSGMTESEVERFEIPTGTPIAYRFSDDMKPVSWQYLGPVGAAH